MEIGREDRSCRGGRRTRGIAGAMALAATASAGAQWSVTLLNPGEGFRSNGNGIAGGMQVGEYQYQGNAGAALWRGSSSTFVDLHPVGKLSTTTANATDGVQQVGWGHYGISSRHAALWSGSAESFVDLNPTGASRSEANGVSGGVQVGSAVLGSLRASLWRGSAETWTDITPAWASRASATSIAGSSIGGYYYADTNERAMVTFDTGSTWTSLHPEGYLRSYVYSVSGDEQAGTVWSSASGQHAALWHGSAESWIDLHPSGLFGSRARSTFDGYQVGYTIAGNYEPEHAAIWNGSAESWFDLQSILPTDFVASQAYGAWSDGQTLMVVGTAARAYGVASAVVWSMPIPAPGTSMPLAVAAMLGMKRVRRRRAVKASDAVTL